MNGLLSELLKQTGSPVIGAPVQLIETPDEARNLRLDQIDKNIAKILTAIGSNKDLKELTEQVDEMDADLTKLEALTALLAETPLVELFASLNAAHDQINYNQNRLNARIKALEIKSPT